MENLADRLKVYAAKKSRSNKRNTLVVKAVSEGNRKRLFARLAFCLLAVARWRTMENPKWEEFYRSEAIALRRILHPKKRAVVEKQDLTAWLLGEVGKL